MDVLARYLALCKLERSGNPDCRGVRRTTETAVRMLPESLSECYRNWCPNVTGFSTLTKYSISVSVVSLIFLNHGNASNIAGL